MKIQARGNDGGHFPDLLIKLNPVYFPPTLFPPASLREEGFWNIGLTGGPPLEGSTVWLEPAHFQQL